MIILLSYLDISAEHLLTKAGYVKHQKGNGWVRNDATGRFHAFEYDSPRRLDIHYDLTIDGKHCSSFYLPRLHSEERKRIVRFLYKQGKVIEPNKRAKMFKKVKKNSVWITR